jgi:hypothetical protein
MVYEEGEIHELPLLTNHLISYIALCAQTQTKKKFASVAKQRLQIFSWFGFER